MQYNFLKYILFLSLISNNIYTAAYNTENKNSNCFPLQALPAEIQAKIIEILINSKISNTKNICLISQFYNELSKPILAAKINLETTKILDYFNQDTSKALEMSIKTKAFSPVIKIIARKYAQELMTSFKGNASEFLIDCIKKNITTPVFLEILVKDFKADLNFTEKILVHRPLHIIVTNANKKAIPIVQKLLELNADVNATNFIGQTPLITAVIEDAPDEIINILVHTPESNINFKCNTGKTALDFADTLGNDSAAKILRSAGAKSQSNCLVS